MAATMRLLVVEDEQRLAAGLRKGLEAEGFAVDVVHSGTDGIWMARENPFDAIVLDIMLPGANGYQVCRTLRSEGNWTPILMLTAKDGIADEVEGLDTGADDYLSKPFSYAVLIARLRALLRRGARPRPTVLEVGDLRLDPAAHRVWRSDVEIPFTAREFAVLEYFVHHPDEVLTKKDILEARQLESGRPTVLDVTGSDEEQFVQVLAPDGSVVASSPNVAGKPVVARLLPGQARHVLTSLDEDEFAAVAEGAQTPDGARTVLVARALVDVTDATTVVTRLLMIGLPVLLVVVALTTWFPVGRALAPVEAIRREVDEISAAQLHRRVPQPGRRRDRTARRDDEPHAGAARRQSKQPAPVCLRRIP